MKKPIKRWINGLRRLLRPKAEPQPTSWSNEDSPIANSPSASTKSDEKRPGRYATWDDAFRVAAILDQHKVEYVLVGGYALNYNGIVRQTRDIDIVVRDEPNNNRQWTKALSVAFPQQAEALAEDPSRPFPVETHDDGSTTSGPVRVSDDVVVDVMPSACGVSYDELSRHAHRVKSSNGSLIVLDLEGLLLTKQGIRAKDIADNQSIQIVIRELRLVDLSPAQHVAAQAAREFTKEEQPEHVKAPAFVTPAQKGKGSGIAD